MEIDGWRLGKIKVGKKKKKKRWNPNPNGLAVFHIAICFQHVIVETCWRNVAMDQSWNLQGGQKEHEVCFHFYYYYFFNKNFIELRMAVVKGWWTFPLLIISPSHKLSQDNSSRTKVDHIDRVCWLLVMLKRLLKGSKVACPHL